MQALERQGNDARDRKDWSAALYYYRQALALYPGDKYLKGHLGYTLNLMGNDALSRHQWADAAEYYKQAISWSRNPNKKVFEGNLALAEWGLGNEAYMKQQWSVAAEYYKQAIGFSRNPNKKVLENTLALAEKNLKTQQIAQQREAEENLKAQQIAQQREADQKRKDAAADEAMRNALSRMVDSLPSGSGNGSDGNTPTGSPGGLNFMGPETAARPAATPAAVRANTIKEINALAKSLGWSAEKQARLDKALNKLGFDGDPNVTTTQISRTWQGVITRGQDPELARKASQGGGLGFPGAGTQTVNNDCAVFALANAAGLPYGVVAARATELIRQGDWREASDRANPQAAIEQKGLTGGEVVMLAESFGHAEVVPSSDFAKALNAGRPIMVNVVPPGGNMNSGHEVVLTKTFQHAGETWFEMIDSNQGPQRRLFVSSKELNTILQENGVAYRPESGTTPKVLRDGRDQ